MLNKLVLQNGGWEIETNGKIDTDLIRFTVRHAIHERIGFKCKVDAEFNRNGSGLEINLIHNKILPSIVRDAIRNMAEDLLKENGISLEPVLRLVHSAPFRRQATQPKYGVR